MTDISFTVGDSVFSAKFYDNKAAKALLEQFLIPLNMADLNGNEKYHNLADSPPFESTEKPAIMNASAPLSIPNLNFSTCCKNNSSAR